MRRVAFSGLYAAVPFCDILLADILTSSAKVLGDVWVAGTRLVGPDELVEANLPGSSHRWMVPLITAYGPYYSRVSLRALTRTGKLLRLPYIFRFRQCISEVVTGSTPTPQKSLLNAVKYASAFPVILLSALLAATGDPWDDPLESPPVPWLGSTAVFNLW